MKTFILAIAGCFLLLSCKKSDDTNTSSSFSFTLNGTSYNSLKCTYVAGTATSYSALADSAQNAGKTKVAGVSLYFNSHTRPTAGTYNISGTGSPAASNFLTVFAVEQASGSTHFFYYAVNVAPTQTASVTDNGKISIQLPQLTLTGQEYDTDFTHPIGSTFTTTLSATAFTEQ